LAIAGIAGLVINPIVMTLLVGILAMMILKGVESVCHI